MTGTVKWFSAAKRFGFIAPDRGNTYIFVHQNDVVSDDQAILRPGQKVCFEVITAYKGPQAVKVTVQW